MNDQEEIIDISSKWKAVTFQSENLARSIKKRHESGISSQFEIIMEYAKFFDVFISIVQFLMKYFCFIMCLLSSSQVQISYHAVKMGNDLMGIIC